jgi:hypothetical protein
VIRVKKARGDFRGINQLKNIPLNPPLAKEDIMNNPFDELVTLLAMANGMIAVMTPVNYRPFIAVILVLASSLKKFHTPICLRVSSCA